MKRSLLFLAILLSLGMVSCKKFLDTAPTDFLPQQQYYGTLTGLQNALDGVYQPLSSYGLYGDNMFDAFGITDEDYYYPSWVLTGTQLFNTDYTDSSFGTTWTTLYQGIERANLLIQNINVATGVDTTTRKAILGEAMFLRGYYYFMLVSNYGDVPLKTTPTASVYAVNVPRTPAKQVYAQVLSDMQAAEGMVYSATTLGFGGRVSKTTVEGILARVCLTMAGYPLNDVSKYQDALYWSQKVVSSGIHSLNPSYSQMFINLHQKIYDIKESMWEAEFESQTGSPGPSGTLGVINGILLQSNYGVIGLGYGYFLSTSKLFNSYSAGDLRRDWAIAPYSYNASTTPVSHSYFITSGTPAITYNRTEAKFRREYDPSPLKGKNAGPINFPILRYADVLLMLAEAENQVNGPDATAYNAINQVRRRAFGLNVNTAGASVSVISGFSLSTSGNTGYAYSTSALAEVPLTITGGGGTGATGMASVGSNGKVNGLTITNPGTGYTSAPTVKVGLVWAANTAYTLGQQVTNGNNLYNVTTAGISTATGPTNTSGASAAATTGAVFTYAGAAAIITANVATTVVDLPAGLSQAAFLQAVQAERSRELCFEALRRPDLIRWGIWVQTMNALGTSMKTDINASFYGALGPLNVRPRNNLFPIPAVEININKAITQNPGW